MGCCHSKTKMVINNEYIYETAEGEPTEGEKVSYQIKEKEFLEMIDWDTIPKNEEEFDKLCDVIRRRIPVEIVGTGKYNKEILEYLEILKNEYKPTNNHKYPST